MSSNVAGNHELSKKEAQPANSSDINDIFDEIVLLEDRTAKEGYDEGYQRGREEGNLEGYQLGYSQGVQLGEELGSIYGAVIAHLQHQNSDKTEKLLKDLKQAIEEFPKDNNPEADIVGAIEKIKNLDKRLKASLGHSKYKTKANNLEEKSEKNDLSF